MGYADAWKEHRNLWKRFLLCWIGGPVVFAVLSLLMSALAGPFVTAQRLEALMSGVFWVTAAGWVLGTLLTAFDLFYGFRCPRCANAFYVKGLTCDNFTRHCLHCRLRKGAVEASEGDAGSGRPPPR